MTNLPTIQAPIHRKPLLLYLALSSFAIDALIAQEDEGGVKQPVYYISHALRETKTRYPKVKNECLGIVYVLQRLCHYFLSYEIHLMTKSHAIKALLRQPILSGRISQWCYNCCNMT